jgi:hypothetical protein
MEWRSTSVVTPRVHTTVVNIFKRLLLVFLGLFVGLTLAEVFLRVFFDHPQPQFLQIDETLGHRHREGVEGYFVKEGHAYVKINEHGFRDDSYSLERSEIPLRVAILGDSYAEALQVNLESTFHGLLESEYQAHMEVLNFGVSGYSTAQALLQYNNLVRRFRPDVVVLSFYPGNDFLDNSRSLSRGYPRPYFVLEKNGLVLDTSFRNDAKFARPKFIYNVYYWLTDRLLIASFVDGLRHMNLTDKQNQTTPSDLVYQPKSQEHMETWEVTEALILALRSEVKKDGATFMLFVQDSLPHQALSETPFYVEERMGGFCVENHLVCTFMGPKAMEENKNSLLHGFGGSGFGHWNEEGHRVAYEVLSDAFKQNKIVMSK